MEVRGVGSGRGSGGGWWFWWEFGTWLGWVGLGWVVGSVCDEVVAVRMCSRVRGEIT